MKKITILLLVFLSSYLSYAQVSSYTFSQSNGTYTPILGGKVYGNFNSKYETFVDVNNPTGICDGFGYYCGLNGTGLPIGFDFIFNNRVFDKIGVNYGGVISLGSSSFNPAVYAYVGELSEPTPSEGAHLRNRIAGFYKYNIASPISEVRVETIGTAPNRICIIQWANVKENGITGDNVNFQIQLLETSNQVKVVYGSCTGVATNTGAEVGLGGESPTDFNNRKGIGSWATTTAGTANADLVNFNNINAPTSGLTFTWTPPAIACKPPTILNITSVAVPNVNFSWSAAPGASSYEYAFTTNQVPPASGANTTALSASVSTAVANTVLYAHVRSNCGGSFSAWKSAVYVPCVNLVSPINGFSTMAYAGISSAYNILPQFNYTSISGISSYKFFFSSDNWVTADSIFTSSTSNLSLFDNPFKKGLNYQWYMKPIYGGYENAVCRVSNTFSFSTRPGPPNCSQLVSPANGATNVALNPTLTWNAPTTGPAPTGYKLYWDAHPKLLNTAIQITAPTISYTFANPKYYYDQPIYWKIRPENAENQATGNTGCEANIFTYKNPALTCGQTFYDTGGPTGQYSSSDSTVTTIYPAVATDKVKVTFNSFDLDNSFSLDTLYIYDGPNINSPSLGKFYYLNSPGAFISSHSTGALTFRFLAGGGNTFNGWAAPVTCVATPLCYPPRVLSVSNIISNSAVLSWTEASVPPGVGYEIYIGNVAPTNITPATYFTTATSRVLSGLPVGSQQNVYVRSYCDVNIKSDWKYIRFYTPPTSPANNETAGALTLAVATTVCDLNTSTTYDFYGATNTSSVVNPSCGKTSVKDLWFKITMPASGAAVFKMSPYRAATQYSNKLGMAIYSDTFFRYYCGTSSDPFFSFSGFSAGTVIYIRVWDEEELSGSPFKICVYDPGAAPNCATITSPANGATNVAINSAITWTAPVGGTTPLNYKVLLSTSNPPFTQLAYLDAATTSFTPNSLLPGLTYYLKIIPNNYGGDAGGTFANCPVISFTNTNPVCTTNFYDPGGVSSNYTGAAPVTTVFTPSAPNLKVKVTFNSFNIDKFSNLKMYDGPTATGAPIGTYTIYNLPTSYSAIGATGKLTFVFTNNSQFSTGIGWDATIGLCEPAGNGLFPTNLSSTSSGPTTSTTANISWNSCDILLGSEFYHSTSATTPLPSATPTFFASSLVLLKNLIPNTRYYAWVRCLMPNGVKGTWRPLPDGFYTKVANDLPVDAITINNTCNGSPYNITNASTNAREAKAGCDYYLGFGGGGGNSGTSKTMWFKFVAPASGSVKISTDYAGGTLPYSRLGLFTTSDINDFGTFTSIACSYSNGVNIGKSNLYAAGLVAGNTYYVSVEQGSIYDEGSFCITVEELNTSMFATASSCTIGKTIFPTNPNYRGWISMVDFSGKLIMNLKQNAGAANAFRPSLNISASLRNDLSSTPYGNRNYFLLGNGILSADIQLFMLDAEYAGLSAILSELNVRNSYSNICVPNYSSGGNLFNQNSSLSQNGISRINATINTVGNFYIQKAILSSLFESITTGNWNTGSTWITPTNTLLPTATKTVKINASHIVSVPNAVNEVKTIQMNGGTINLNGGNLEIKNQ